MIGSSENRISYNGNGIATEFAYTFKILEKSDMKVLHVAADGTETPLTKDYYVDMDKSVVLYPGYAPGEEIPEQNRPPILSEGEMLVLYREVPITQESALDKHWPFNVIENGLDKLTIICQQIWDRLQRSFYVSESTSSNFDTKVPIEAGKTFRVKDDGTGFEVTEDPARVLPLAQGVYAQTKEQAEFAKEQADASSEAANAAKTSETNAKNYSENVNVFLPSVSDSGVLSWTNKAGLPNPASVNIKGAKGDTGDKGDTGNAATIEVGTVTTGAAGSSASVTNRGDANNVILDFILPKGVDGKGSVITVNGKEPDAGGNVNVKEYTHPASGVTAGSYRKVTVDTLGHVTAGENPILAVAEGGTGADNATSALSNLGILDAIVNASVSGTTITFTKKDNTKFSINTQDTNNGIVAALLKQNGYVKFANGLILQWGVSVTSNTGPVTITYPIAHTLFACPYTTSTMSFEAVASINTSDNTVQSFSVHARWGRGDLAADTFNWFSVGI